MPIIRVDPLWSIDRKEVDYKYIHLDYSIGTNERLAVDTSNGPGCTSILQFKKKR